MDDLAIADLFAGLGTVRIRRLFGGKGIHCDGILFAIELRGEIMLKADAATAPEFAAAGSRQWTYAGRSGKPVAMPYWSIPENAFDDPDEMTHWAIKAHEAGKRTGAGG